MNRKNLILLALLFVFEVLFYQQKPGVNMLIFNTLLLIGSLLYKPELKSNLKWLLMAISLLISSACVAYYGDALSCITAFITIAVIASLHFESKSSVGVALAGTMLSYICSPFYFIQDVINQVNTWQETKDKYGLTKIGLALLATVIVLVFFFIYRSSNVMFYSFTQNINLDFISLSWILFTINGLLLIFTFFNYRPFNFFKRYIDEPNQILISNELNNKTNKDFALNPTLELFTGRFLLILLNILLLIVNTLDFNYFIKGQLPSGVSYSEYVHQGVGLLIFSIIIAISIILFLFRGELNFYKQSKFLRVLAYIWIFQNILIAISILLRNNMYINALGLTEKRIGVYVYLLLCIIGLVITILKLKNKYSNAYFIRLTSWIFYAILLLSCPINWDNIITKHNLQRTDIAENIDYLNSLSDSNLPLLLAYAKEHSLDTQVNSNQIEYSIHGPQQTMYNNLTQERTWKSYTIDRYYIDKALQNVDLQKFQLSYINISKIDVLCRFKNLKELELDNCYNFDNQNIRNLSQLKKLSITNSSISSINFLYHMPNIEYLDLSNSKIKNYAPLLSMKNLKTLKINKPNNKITKYLQDHLPNTQIEFIN
jgi:hypothetical protein